MRVAGLFPAQRGAGAFKLSAHPSRRARCRSFRPARADQSVSWLDKGMSSNVRSDYDAVIVLAGNFPGRQQKSLQSSLPVTKECFRACRCPGHPVQWLTHCRVQKAQSGHAGGLTPRGGLPEWVTRRLDAAADIYHVQGL